MDRKIRLYLDLTAIDPVGRALLDERPAFVVESDTGQFAWANAAGALLFGETSINGLLGRRIPAANPARAQISDLHRSLPAGRTRLEILRIGVAEKTIAMPAQCRRIDFGDELRAVLAIVTEAARKPSPLRVRAERLATALADGLQSVAVLDATDRVIAEAGDVALPALLRHLSVTDAPAVPGTSTVTTEQGLHEMAVVRFAADGRPWHLALARRVEASTVPTMPALQRATEPAAAVARPADGDAGSEVVRFIWSTDATGRIAFVSQELAHLVGAASATIAGMDWRTVARHFDMTLGAAADHAMDRGSAWTATVLWPSPAGPVAVDLVAAPEVTREHGFTGFRGFGFGRGGARHRQDDVDEIAPINASTETTAVAPAAPVTVDPPTEPTPRAPPEPIEPPQPSLVEDRGTDAEVTDVRLSNVVQLPGTRPQPDVPQRLTGVEQDAFRRIAEALAAGRPRGQVAETEPSHPPADERPPASPGPEPQSDATLRVLLDRIPIGLLVVRDGRTVFVNRTLLGLLDYRSADGFAAAGGIERIFPGDAAGLASGVDRPAGELAARRADGATVRVRVQLNAIEWESTGALLMSIIPVGEHRDNADERLADKVAAAERRVHDLDAILDTATDGIVVIDRDGRIEGMNRAAEALFGGDEHDFQGHSLTELLAEESHRPALDYLEGLAENGVASVLNDGREVIGKVAQGGLLPLFMTIGRIGDSGRFCAVLRDMTHWKTVEDELINARSAAENANAQKSEFLAKISHEIRTPLNAIIGFSEIMMEERFGAIGNDRYRAYLSDIHVSGEHLISLINDLLDLSKVEAGKLELTFEAVSLNAIIQECVALMQPLANRERIIIRTSLSSEIPSVVADPRSFRQILLNLVSNAIKFTGAGGQVIVSTAMEGAGEVVVRIRDTGVGMSPKDVETALKPFRQVARAKEGRDKGTGLGLPLTKALIEANRATMAIESAPNQGTLIRITFPTERVLAG